MELGLAPGGWAEGEAAAAPSWLLSCRNDSWFTQVFPGRCEQADGRAGILGKLGFNSLSDSERLQLHSEAVWERLLAGSLAGVRGKGSAVGRKHHFHLLGRGGIVSTSILDNRPQTQDFSSHSRPGAAFPALLLTQWGLSPPSPEPPCPRRCSASRGLRLCLIWLPRDCASCN